MVPLLIAAYFLGVFDGPKSSSSSGGGGKKPTPDGTAPKTGGSGSDWGRQLGLLLEGIGKGAGSIIDAANNDDDSSSGGAEGSPDTDPVYY